MQVLAPVGMRAAALPRRAKTSTVSQRSVVVSAGPQEEIYIGFVKEEGFGSREGKKGRVIKDDPRKYPSRDEYGTGGWAGGEVGLWELRDAVKSDKKAGSKKPVAAVGPSSPLVPRAPAGKAPIYVGFGKDELELRKSGVKGRIVVDDPRKYPNKEDIGPLSGVAGGFAGGEKGVKQFVATGDIKLRKPGEPGPRQFSPLTLAGVVALGGFGAAALLSQFGDAGLP
ncbi:hypothetical protein HYH03_002735 [Edaphochlamys debaryana]|uniref:Uncharacterized protein n=1 Tax=Edaphochlamys debaryana TaxID=47281 RepID=A0A836C4Q5_9CHLO|nr:hypothetical protein HYH03_002735 [Edaphochlamys debaryana]|eukprot:KAG2499153.1 hypothetical protein HYH03_002735 [Edaphochlamys debaryana]